MAADWREVRLGELCEFRAGSAFKPGFQGQSLGSHPFIKVSDMDLEANHFRIHEANNWVSDADLGALRTRPYPEGSTVFAKIGEALKRNRRRLLVRPTVIDNNMMAAVPREEAVDPVFLFYLLSSLDFETVAAGTALPYLKQSTLNNLRARIPPLQEQRRIGSVLLKFDLKIELNRRMNQTLEGIALAIFKSWFVDFDPVRAKMEGRQLSGTSADVVDLFPDRLLDSELGEIPEGWRIQRLPEVIEVNPPRSLRKGEVAPYLDMANMPTGGHTPDQVVHRPFGSGMRFVNGDTLVARITPCLENGKTAYVDFLETDQVGWGSTEYIVLRPKSPFPEEFAYCLARSESFREFAIQSMTGSSGRQRVPAGSLNHYFLPSPPDDLLKRFGSLVRPHFERSSASARESRTLASLRDTLLPKLVSGESRLGVNGAE